MSAGPGLFERALAGAGWDALPLAVRAFHGRTGAWDGRADIERGRHPLARAIAAAVGFPLAGLGVPVRVETVRDGDGERWTRRFGDRAFGSRLGPAGPGRVVERLGPAGFVLALAAGREGLGLTIASGRCLGIPIPRRLLPSGHAREAVDADGRFRFDIAVMVRVAGLVVRYRGWLRPAGPAG